MAHRTNPSRSKTLSVSPRRKVSRARQAPPAGATAWFPIALLGLFAVGCAAATKRRQDVPLRRSMSFQVSEDSALYETAREAARLWSEALGLPVTATSDGIIPIFLTDSPTCPVPSNLPPGAQVGGCSQGVGTPDQRIEIPTYLAPENYLTVLLHEMGHHLRGKPGQHVAKEHALMSQNVENGQGITPDDIAFVCTPPSQPGDPNALDCHPPSSTP